MAEHWRQLLEHIPFVMATGPGPKLDMKYLIGAVTIGAISAVGSSMLTTEELSVEVRVLAKQVEGLQNKVDSAVGNHSALAERVTRMEAVQTGMNGARR